MLFVRTPEICPPRPATRYDVERFCAENEVGVALDWSALHREANAGDVQFTYNTLTHETNYRHVYAPWYRVIGTMRDASYEHWLGDQWSFAELGNPKYSLPEAHSGKIARLERNLLPGSLRALTLAIGRRKLVLDGNHRLAAFLRKGDSLMTVHELCITAKPGSQIVPDTWSWYLPNRRWGATEKTIAVANAMVASSVFGLWVSGSGENLPAISCASLVIGACFARSSSPAARAAQGLRTLRGNGN